MQLRSVFLAALVTVVLIAVPATAFGDEGNYLLHHATNLATGTNDTIVNVINTGSSNGATSPIPGGYVTGNGNVCLNVYAFNAGGLAWCCQCVLGPNASTSFSVNSEIVANAVGSPTNLVIKLVATAQGVALVPGGAGSPAGPAPTCDASAINAGYSTNPLIRANSNVLSSGLSAFARNQVGTAAGTESEFSRGQIVSNEVNNILNAQCSAFKAGGGAGYCGGTTVLGTGACKAGTAH